MIKIKRGGSREAERVGQCGFKRQRSNPISSLSQLPPPQASLKISPYPKQVWTLSSTSQLPSPSSLFSWPLASSSSSGKLGWGEEMLASPSMFGYIWLEGGKEPGRRFCWRWDRKWWVRARLWEKVGRIRVGEALRNECRSLLGKHKGDGRGGESFVCTGFGGQPLSPYPARPILQSPFLRLPGEEGEKSELPLHTLHIGSLSPSHLTARIIRLRRPGH